MVEKSTEKSRLFTQEPFFITPIWRAISMNIRGGWLTIIKRGPDNDGMAWRFWQHSDRGQVDGINGPVDFNVFNGTVEEVCRDSLMGLKKRLK